MTEEIPDWRERGVYIATRSRRRPSDFDIKPRWANEAYLDEQAVTFDPDYASRSGRGIRTIGFSISAGFHITVITLRENGQLIGANAWKANGADLTRYIDEEES